jgi:uncharacterized protein YjiK
MPRLQVRAGLVPVIFLPVLLLSIPLLSGSALAQTSSIDGYDLSKNGGEEIKLAAGLREISGLAMDASGHLFAHNDERAVIYQLDPELGQVLKAFSAGFQGAPGDFEGLAIGGERFFLSTSGGDVLETAEGPHGSAMDYRLHSLGLGEQCEFEGLAFDEKADALLLPCKKPRDRDLRKHIVVFSVARESMEVNPVPRIFLPLEELEEFDLDDSFSPSAIEIHPETGNIFLVSAQDEVLLEFSTGGALLGGRTLHKKTHPQPEGISFGADGTLYLADEGQGKRGRLTRYSYSGGGEEGGR